MKALVTGATGFVGSHLVDHLVARGDEVTAMVRSPGKAARVLPSTVRLVEGDLHSLAALAAAAGGQDVVYHVAGMIAARSEAEFLHANRDGTMHVVDAIRAAGRRARLVLVSSMAAGGPARRGEWLTGSETPRPVTSYGRSKLAGEEVVRASGLRWSIVRPPLVYGPRDLEVLKVFQLSRLPVTPVFGDGLQELSVIHVADLARALVAAALAEAALGGTYYACHPEVVTTTGFVRAVARAVRPGRSSDPLLLKLPRAVAWAALTVTGTAAALSGKATVLSPGKLNELFVPAWTGDPAPLTRASGWSAAIPLAEGLASTAQWYREAGLL
ncbi:MAG: NAD-dependent epimerase/dehydratase family protein [Gemmatimonadales bacterium]